MSESSDVDSSAPTDDRSGVGLATGDCPSRHDRRSESQQSSTSGRWIALLLAVWAVVVLIAFAQRALPMVAACLPAAKTVAWFVLSVYVFWFSGFRLLRRLCGSRLELDAPGSAALEIGFGAALAMFAMLGLATVGLLKPWCALVILLCGALGTHRAFLRSLHERVRELRSVGPLAGACLSAIAVVTFLRALAPSTAQDALIYHLTIPKTYIASGGLQFLPGNAYAQFPQNMEMLFALALLLDGDTLANLFHWLFGVTSALGCASLAGRLTRKPVGALAACFFASVPSVVVVAGWAYVDLAVVHYVIASTLCFAVAHESGRRSWWVAAAVLAGVGVGCKYTAGIQGIFLAVAAFLCARPRGLRAAVLEAGVVCAIVGALAWPWLIKNVYYTGNPIFPFAYGIFGGLGWDHARSAEIAQALRDWGGDRGWLATLLLPWRLTVDAEFYVPKHFDGMIGPVFLVGLPLVVLAMRKPGRARVVLWLALGHAVFWALTTRQIRFLLPTLALTAPLLAAAVAAAPWIWLRAACGAAVGINLLLSSVDFASRHPLAVVFGLESRQDYLRRNVPGGDYPVFEYIAQTLPPESYILCGSLGNPGFLIERRFHADAIFENQTLGEMLSTSSSTASLRAAFAVRGYTHLLFRDRLVFDGTGESSRLSQGQQQLLGTFLNRYGELKFAVNGTMLFAIGPQPRDARNDDRTAASGEAAPPHAAGSQR